MQREKGLSPSLDRLEIKKRLEALVKKIQEDGETDMAEWLIAWWSIPDRMPVALHLMSHRPGQWAEEWEFAGDKAAVDIAKVNAGSVRYVPRDSLTVEQAKVLALKVMRDTIRMGVESIGGEVQLGAVRESGTEVVTGTKLRGLHDTLEVWLEQSAELLPGGVKVPAQSTTPDRGVRPPGSRRPDAPGQGGA